MKILIIEDDVELCDIIKTELEKEHYTIDCCHDGADASYYALQPIYDLILLDRMLPGENGIHILKSIRNAKLNTPVILITALDQLADKIEGLDDGADDYLSKPFAMGELSARIRAILRRPVTMNSNSQEFRYGDLILTEENLALTCGLNTATLTQKEYLLLEFLIKNSEKILTREYILSAVWPLDSDIEYSNVDNYIYFLRKRFKQLGSKVSIKTVYGKGYRLQQEEGTL